MRKEKGAEPLCCRVCRQSEEKGIENGIEEPRERTDHNHDLKPYYEIKHYSTIAECSLLIHMTSITASAGGAPCLHRE